MSAQITAAERVAIARNPQRPNITDYIDALFTDFFECKGDRLCGEDAGILGGVALFHGRPVTVIGTRKGKTLEENLKCNFGMPSPEGYRKALRLMRQAEKFRRPIITLIDGKTRVESKVRGDDKVIPAMIDLCKKRTEGVEDFDYMIGHTSIPQAAELEKACRKAFGKAPLVTFNLGGVVSANTGPDTLALVYVGKPRD